MKTPEFKLTELRDWLKKTLDILYKQNDREILFVVDLKGCKGKSTLAKHLMCNNNAILLPGSPKDAFYIYNGEEIAIFDVPKSFVMDSEFYITIEEIKNGFFVSTKYEPVQKIFNPPKIVVFTNKNPDMLAMSYDRYKIYTI